MGLTYAHHSATGGVERKRQRLAAEAEREVTARAFSAYGHRLYIVTYFRYLRYVILAADSDWTAVLNNLSWVRALWRKMT